MRQRVALVRAQLKGINLRTRILEFASAKLTMYMCLSVPTTVLIFITVTSTRGVAAENDTKPVYFSLIFSGGENGYNSSGGIPAIHIALEAIKDQQLLPGYNLTYETARNSKCTRTDSLDVFYKDTQYSSVPKIAVIGCGCSTATEPVAEISHYWNISQISFASASSALRDRTRFKYYFRTTPSFNNYAPAILGLLNKFNWKRLAFITQNQNLFLKIVSDYKELLQMVAEGKSELCCFGNSEDFITESAVFENDGDPISSLLHIFDEKKFHVIFLNCYSKNARKIICEAYKRGYVYPHYAWILFGWYVNKWWTTEIDGEHLDECTDQQLEDFLRDSRAISIGQLPEPDDYDLTTVAGFTAREFAAKYSEILMQTEYIFSPIYALAFDAMWTVAQVLNYTEEMRLRNQSKGATELKHCATLPGQLEPLNEFNYANAFMGCVMNNNFYKVNFTGVSGPVRYGNDGTIIYSRIRLTQMRAENNEVRKVRFGYLDRDSNFSLRYVPGESDDSLFPDGVPPDGTPIDIVHTYHTSLVALYYILAFGGVILSSITFLFNFICRKKKVIRLTTPLLNFVIISGALLMYISVFFGLLPTKEENIIQMQCIIHVWMYVVGYLLVYGTILAKMWRVYQIFHNPNPNKTILKTWHLLCVVAIITGIGVVLSLAKTVAQAVTEPQLVSNSEKPQGTTSSDIREDYHVWQCYGSGSAPFIIDLIIFIYLGLLQFVGIMLAFQTRKVKITVLNDSKSVTTMIYISSIVLVVMVLITFILRSYINLSAAVFSGGIIILATFFLVLSFVPKVASLYHDPTGEKIFSSTNPTALTCQTQTEEHHNMAVGISELTDTEKISLLTSRVKSLEQKIKDKDRRIVELENIVKS